MNCYVCNEKVNILNCCRGKSGTICRQCFTKLSSSIRFNFSQATKEDVLRDIALWEDSNQEAKNIAGSPKKICANCGKEISMMNRKKLAGTLYICKDCYEQCSLLVTSQLSQKTLTDIKNDIERMNQYPEFSPTNTYGKISFDENNKLWKAEKYPVFKYEDINDYEIIEEREEFSTSITTEKTKTKKGGVGRAVVGGALFGPVGAIVGSNTGKRKSITKGRTNTSSTEYYTKLGIKIFLNKIDTPVISVNFIRQNMPVRNCENIIDEINNVAGFINIITNSDNSINEVEETSNMVSVADEILKFKTLLDSGVITQEEFEAKKKQLLGL